MKEVGTSIIHLVMRYPDKNTYNIGCDMTKLTKCVCAQRRLRSGESESVFAVCSTEAFCICAVKTDQTKLMARLI